MYRILALLAVACLFTAVASAAPQPVKALMEWKGSVEDEKLAAEAPKDNVIADQKALEKLWTAWKVTEKVPTIDFNKEIVLVATTSGSRLNISASLSEGDLKVLAIATRDLRPGFRYQIITVPREGVKKINGKEIK
jgi:hypothetical protein